MTLLYDIVCIWVFVFQSVSGNLGSEKIKNITKEEALLNKEIEVNNYCCFMMYVTCRQANTSQLILSVVLLIAVEHNLRL